MAQGIESAETIQTAVDLARQFGAIPLGRVGGTPPSGVASEEDVVALHDREGRLFELVDGVLLEKTMGTYEAYLASLLGRWLGNFVEKYQLGIVLGADGMLRLAPDLVRIPDVSFISWDRLPDRKIPRDAIASVIPDLAVEVLSRGNTPEEMDRKRTDYFKAGVRAVWYIHPESREVRVYTTADEFTLLSEKDTLDGGLILPGLEISLTRFFAEPGLM